MKFTNPKTIPKRQRMRKLGVALSFLGVFAIGCVMPAAIPTTTKVIGPSLEAPPLNLEVGHTTKYEVVRTVGPPYAILEDESVFIYFWYRSNEWAFARKWYVTWGFLRFDEKEVLSGFTAGGKSLRKWLREQTGKELPVQDKVEKVSLLMRIIGTVDGELDTNLNTRVGLRAGNLKSGGYMGRLIGRKYGKDGWIKIKADPGDLYLSIISGGHQTSLNPYHEMNKDWRIWRVDVPPGVPLIYIGTFKIIGESIYKTADGGPVRLTHPPELLDESDKAQNIAKEAFPEKPDPVISLAVEHEGPLIFTLPSNYDQPGTD